jgi:integrase/recombinase XerD
MKPAKNRGLTLTQVITGYLLEASARRLSPHTVADYTNSFRKLQIFQAADTIFSEITADDIRRFLADLSTPREPAGIARRPAKPLSEKQILNIHTGLSALWTWAVAEGYADTHILREIQRPRPQRPAIVPLSQVDVKAILEQIDKSRGFQRAGQRIADYQRPTALRDRCIVLLMLDTGVRASELCGLQLRHVDLKNRSITVLGKGNKERALPFGPSCGKSLFRYISLERKEARVNDPLFLATGGAPLDRGNLLKLLQRLGQRAGVPDVHPHRFRHTFAIEYLRNGGNTRALQEALGHETLEMLRVYTRIAEADLRNAHNLASPVEHWRL